MESQNEKIHLTKNKMPNIVRLGLYTGLVGIIAFLLLLLVTNRVMAGMEQYILTNTTSAKVPVGIVFGAGITPDGKPYKELQARLDTAADALEKGTVQKIILSGDNRFLNYNEPEAMKFYMIDSRGISEEFLQVDYAGRSTYETCERASKIFSVKHAILFSSYSHLPRAIFTCRSFGIESFGIGNDLEANNASRREPIAQLKALFNIYFIGEETILGDKIDLGL